MTCTGVPFAIGLLAASGRGLEGAGATASFPPDGGRTRSPLLLLRRVLTGGPRHGRPPAATPSSTHSHTLRQRHHRSPAWRGGRGEPAARADGAVLLPGSPGSRRRREIGGRRYAGRPPPRAGGGRAPASLAVGSAASSSAGQQLRWLCSISTVSRTTAGESLPSAHPYRRSANIGLAGSGGGGGRSLVAPTSLPTPQPPRCPRKGECAATVLGADSGREVQEAGRPGKIFTQRAGRPSRWAGGRFPPAASGRVHWAASEQSWRPVPARF